MTAPGFKNICFFFPFFLKFPVSWGTVVWHNSKARMPEQKQDHEKQGEKRAGNSIVKRASCMCFFWVQCFNRNQMVTDAGPSARDDISLIF